jgi:ABC-type uncharacterized transport system fused permease/ATPase subunit
MPTDELGALISRNMFFVLYLLNKCTNLLELSDPLSKLSGYSSRICEMLEHDEASSSFQDHDLDVKTSAGQSSPEDSWSTPSSVADVAIKPPLSVLSEAQLSRDCTAVALTLVDFSACMHNGFLIHLNLWETAPRRDCESSSLSIIQGPSGIGKTSLVRALCGLIPSTGTVSACTPDVSPF